MGEDGEVSYTALPTQTLSNTGYNQVPRQKLVVG